MFENLTDEQLKRKAAKITSEVKRRLWDKKTQEQRTAQGKLMSDGRAKMSPAQRVAVASAGGTARAKRMTRAERSEVARKGGLARAAKMLAAKATKYGN